MAIRVERNAAGNCLVFHGQTNPVYFNACLRAEIIDTDYINIINDISSDTESATTKYEYFRIHFSEFRDGDNGSFADADAFLTYFNDIGNVTDVPGAGTVFPPTSTLDFTRDETNTSILFSNGDHHGINAIKAVDKTNGKVGIFTIRGDVELYELEQGSVTIMGAAPVSTTLAGIVNELNAFFTLSALGGAVTAAPVYTMEDGVDINWIGRETVNPIGDGDYGATGSSYHGARVYTAETINEPGEYYTFEMKNTVAGGGALAGIGLYSVNNGDLAEVTDDSLSNSGHHGYFWSNWLYNYNGYTAPWTTYGSHSSLSYGPGWTGHGNSKMFRYSDANLAFRDGDTALFKCGITEGGFVGVWYYDVEVEGRDGGYGARSNEWILLARSTTPLVEGEYGLMVKIASTSCQMVGLPKRFATDAAAPTLYYRYVESPDGVFHFPLFATEEEANYVDSLNGGSGTSHTHTYVDDASGTTWYMPDTGSTMSGSSAPVNTTEITYTAVPTEPDGNYVPSAFSGLDITKQEGDNVVIQVTPAGASWSTTVSGLPAGLVFDGYSTIMGTCPEVTSDTDYTVSVTRANAFGSSTGSFTLTVTDVAPVQTNDTPWTKALDFSGSAERAQPVSSSTFYTPMKMGGTANQVANPVVSGNTVDSGYPWATACVFKIDGHSSNQHIWNLGEGAGDNDDNIYLRLDSGQRLYFGWGRSGALNECLIHTLSSAWWYGIYVGFNGARYGAAGSTASRLDDIFDIRLMSSIDSFGSLNVPSTDLMTGWTHGASSTGGRMDREFNGYMTIGGRGSNRSFHGKVASFVTTTLRCGVAMPDDTEITKMITDPVKWLNEDKVGNNFRRPYYTTDNTNFSLNSYSSADSAQVWLMGDGPSDSYSNMIRNRVLPADQNRYKLNMLSMVSNDIQTVNIPGLT